MRMVFQSTTRRRLLHRPTVHPEEFGDRYPLGGWYQSRSALGQVYRRARPDTPTRSSSVP